MDCAVDIAAQHNNPAKRSFGKFDFQKRAIAIAVILYSGSASNNRWSLNATGIRALFPEMIPKLLPFT